MRTHTLALVESPAQFLHVLEWCHAEQAAARTRLAVLAPSDPTTVAQLEAMSDFAAEEGIALSWHTPRRSATAAVRTVAELRADVAAAARLVVGDPFSGMIQSLLPFSHADEVVVVDDGTATLEFATQLVHGEPLRRWHAGLTAVRSPLARHARAFFSGPRLRLFTVMSVTSVPGSRVQHHTYDWTRRRFGPPRLLRGVDVLGSSLVETGVVEVEGYLDAVARIAERTGAAGRYFAHRREQPEKLRELSRRTGLRIVRPRVPLEIELRRGPVAAELASFPSSVGFTLPLVLAGVGTRVSVQPLPDSMLSARVGERARSFLDRIGQDMQRVAVQPAAVSWS
ncbi:MAG: hypothetical protein QM779_08660 [Propionicimonas sp.]|uniref:hypothetical protein n=1 Tax=Propionicimonas sp. TaxID=1955623 RepID=UPI003D0F9A38